MILYKYFPNNINSIKSISTSGLWCGYSNNMNDPSECLGYLNRKLTKYQINQFREAFSGNLDPKMNTITKWPDNKVEEIFNQYRKKFIEIFAFCSLSETFDDVLMWSHYASGHTGFVVGFEFEKNELNHNLQKINYTNKLPKPNVLQVASFMMNNTDEISFFIKDISIKSEVWANEKEWRIWQQKPGYYLYDSEKVKNIYFGVNCDIYTQKLILKSINSKDKIDIKWMTMETNPVKLGYRNNYL